MDGGMDDEPIFGTLADLHEKWTPELEVALLPLFTHHTFAR